MSCTTQRGCTSGPSPHAPRIINSDGYVLGNCAGTNFAMCGPRPRSSASPQPAPQARPPTITPAADPTPETHTPAIADLVTLFDYNDDDLRTDQRAPLEAWARSVAAANKVVRVVGHASTEGAGNYNMDLAKRRATTVATALRTAGAHVIAVLSRGETEPVGNPESRELSRRVVSTALDAGAPTPEA